MFRFFLALSTLIGYIIGVGMFGLPYLFVKAGLLPCVILVVVLGVVQYYIHMIYADIIVENPGFHRMPGYASKYLGVKGKGLAFFASLAGNYGALIAYIIVGGIFAEKLFSPIFGGSSLFWATALFCAEGLVVYFGIKFISRFELIFTLILLIMILAIAKIGLDYIQPASYTLINWKYALLPYGAMLFAFDGGGVIPMMAEIVKKDKALLKKAIGWGTFISVAAISFFALVVAGITGAGTTPDALTGLWDRLDGRVMALSLAFGLIVIITSFLGAAQGSKEMFCWDYKLGNRSAFFLAVILPYLLFLAGINNFIGVISFSGAISGGLTGLVLIMIFWQLEKNKKRLSLFRHKPGLVFLGLVSILFILGIFYEIWYFFSQ